MAEDRTGTAAEPSGDRSVVREHLLRPSTLGLSLCASLAFSLALWSLFQWTQLLSLRTGGAAFCGAPGGDVDACTAIWGSQLATTLQSTSGLPVAGWGLVWSLVAFAFPIWALARRARRSEAPDATEPEEPPALWAATAVMAAGGLTALGILLWPSIREVQQCGACMISCALMLSYAGVTLLEAPLGFAGSILRGVSLSSGSVALAYVLLFIPGLRTPESSTVISPLARSLSPEEVASRAEDDATEIKGLIEQLGGRRLGDFVRALDEYRNAEPLPRGEPRVLVGAPNAPVRITHFTDLTCRSCGTLHTTLAKLRTSLPPRSFSIEPRYFPLDEACNDAFEGEPKGTIQCLAARSQICLEGQPDSTDLRANLYRRGRRLDEEGLYGLAQSLISRPEFTACITAPETELKLQQDISAAAEYSFDGLPLVLLNGRQVRPMAPLLYALIRAQGDAYHSAFEALPTPEEIELRRAERKRRRAAAKAEAEAGAAAVRAGGAGELRRDGESEPSTVRESPEASDSAP